MYRLHTTCRACSPTTMGANGIKSGPKKQQLIKVADFGVMPLANDFRKEGEEHAGFAPLEVMLCPRCHLAQLSVVVDPHILYSNYAYVTSSSSTMMRHFETILRQMTERLGHLPVSILEIGSNDGKFLKFAQVHGVREAHGIEPDEKLAQTANEIGVPTTRKYWPNGISSYGQTYDIILARHVFAHVDDWHGFVAKAAEFMHEHSILWIEAPWVASLLSKHQVDTIYHEHLSYINIGAIQALLADSPLYLSDIIHYDLHGGSIALLIKLTGNNPKPVLVTDEGFLNVERWQAFNERAIGNAVDLRLLVLKLREQGKKVVGYGASAKSTFWVRQCRFTHNELAFIADDTKAKWYTSSPGTDIPIVDEGALIRELPDFAICFAWNYLPELLKKNDYWICKGGKFIVPVPEVKIVP